MASRGLLASGVEWRLFCWTEAALAATAAPTPCTLLSSVYTRQQAPGVRVLAGELGFCKCLPNAKLFVRLHH